MKGVSKNVVEIVEPKNEYIERVLVFLRPDVLKMHVGHEQEEAEKYAANLVCTKKRLSTKMRVIFGILAAAAVLGVILLLLAY